MQWLSSTPNIKLDDSYNISLLLTTFSRQFVVIPRAGENIIFVKQNIHECFYEPYSWGGTYEEWIYCRG